MTEKTAQAVPLQRFYDSCTARGLDVSMTGDNIATLTYQFDSWDISYRNNSWYVTRHDNLSGTSSTTIYAGSKPITDIIRITHDASYGFAAEEENKSMPLDQVRQIYYICQRKGIQVQYQFGYVYITTKFESWYFIPSNGKIRLMHRNTRPDNNTDWHEQFSKYITMPNLGNYFSRHSIAEYVPRNRMDEAETLIQHGAHDTVQA